MALFLTNEGLILFPATYGLRYLFKICKMSCMLLLLISPEVAGALVFKGGVEL